MISPRVRFTKIITAPIINSQSMPIRKPDCANTYGSPRIPAPTIVPVRVNVVAQNFLFIIFLFVRCFVFIRFIAGVF